MENIMKKKFEQTYWNATMHQTDFHKQFVDWVGEADAESKVFFRNLVEEKNIENILDVGCGFAADYKPLIEKNPNVKYVGLDSCVHLIDRNSSQGVPMILSDATEMPFDDSTYELVYSRHTFEHQPTFEHILDEMIRVSNNYVAHTFFIKPSTDSDVIEIKYTQHDNLHHNTYDRNEIEKFCSDHPKVRSFEWFDINKDEEMLFIKVETE